MKWIALASLLLAAAISTQAATGAKPAITWGDAVDEALAQSAETGKPVLIHFWTDDCAPCVKQERLIFSDPEVVKAVENRFIPVKVNAKELPDVASKYDVHRVPTDVVVDPGGSVRAHFCGSGATPALYLMRLCTLEPGWREPDQNDKSHPPSSGGTEEELLQGMLAALRKGLAMAGNCEPTSPWLAPAADRPVARAAENPPSVEPPTPVPLQAASDMETRPSKLPSTSSDVAVDPPMIRITLSVEFPLAWTARRTRNNKKRLNESPEFGRNLASTAPAMGLAGYCPVTLKQRLIWLKGNPEFGAVHRGRTYSMASEELRRQFLLAPDDYAPALSGCDVVLAAETGKRTPGTRERGYQYQGRCFLFVTDENMRRFMQDPTAYAKFAAALEALPKVDNNLE